jgi:hypothetical protein
MKYPRNCPYKKYAKTSKKYSFNNKFSGKFREWKED